MPIKNRTVFIRKILQPSYSCTVRLTIAPCPRGFKFTFKQVWGYPIGLDEGWIDEWSVRGTVRFNSDSCLNSDSMADPIRFRIRNWFTDLFRTVGPRAGSPLAFPCSVGPTLELSRRPSHPSASTVAASAGAARICEVRPHLSLLSLPLTTSSPSLFCLKKGRKEKGDEEMKIRSDILKP